MKFRVKDLDIATGGVIVIVLNQKDANKLDLRAEDRIWVRYKNRKTIALVDIAESSKHVEEGKVGCFEEILDKLNIRDKDIVEVSFARKPPAIHFIREKLDGKRLKPGQIDEVIGSIVRDELSEGELTYFVAACHTNGMSLNEIISLTKATVRYGDSLRFNKGIVLDKHCSGGVPGNRTTMLVVPIITAAGFLMPKTSSRSITSPAGTADTMEVLAKVAFPVKKIRQIVKKTNGCIVWGGGMNLASADDKLIRVRHPLSIDPDGMLIASILAKKLAVGATHVLIDLPVGRHTKIKTYARAGRLAKLFKRVGRSIGMRIFVVTTNGEEPIGNGIGPLLEARDVLYVLQRHHRRPLDLEKKVVFLAGAMLKIAGVKNGITKAREILESGRAYKKMQEIIKAQEGNPTVNPDRMRPGRFSWSARARKNGRIADINTKSIARLARIAGAPIDQTAGLYLYKHEKEKVRRGDLLFTLYAENMEKLRFAKDVYKQFGGIIIT